MHDIDRTQREFESAMNELQPEYFEYSNEANEWGEYEGETYSHEAWQEIPAGETWQEAEQYEGEYNEYQGETYEYQGEHNEYEGGNYEYAGETDEFAMSETQEMELAAELLEISNEYELDQFFGNFFKKIGKAFGKAVNSPLGKALGGVLKPLAKQVLPIAGSAVGSLVGGPLGAQLGNKVTSAAGQLFGLELEGLSGEDREYEMSRRFVRFASNAVSNALRAPGNFGPQNIARRSMILAMRRMAPGLRRAYCNCPPPVFCPPLPDVASMPGDNPPVSGPTGPTAAPAGPESQGEYGFYTGASSQRGTWVRQGNRIILYGV
jgi:hypothetical protein